jgi:hypothetical protein
MTLVMLPDKALQGTLPYHAMIKSIPGQDTYQMMTCHLTGISLTSEPNLR